MRTTPIVPPLMGLLLLTAAGCKPDNTNPPSSGPGPGSHPLPQLSLTSPAFASGQPIPKRFTGEGEDLSPPLTWVDPPAGTQQFALIMDDPDAPGQAFVHWVMFNIPADARNLAEGAGNVTTSATEKPAIGLQGTNDFDKPRYNGPLPPPGRGPHRYFIRLYALDRPVDLPPGANEQALLSKIQGHILAAGEWMGTYERK